MMKKHVITILIISVLVGSISLAQTKQDQRFPIPTSISQNCLLTQSGTIDFCPLYRNEVRELNLELSKQRTVLEAGGTSKFSDALTKSILDINTKKKQLLQTTPNDYNIFITEYELYLSAQLYQYAKQHAIESNIVESFFKTTYFDQDQGGLGISDIKVYNGTPQQYDKSVLLQISIRNYTPNPISNVEDLYCFTTIDKTDYIYPIGIQPSFKENTVTNLIVELKPDTSGLLDSFGDKKIACTLVYSQNGQMKYSNRGTTSFIVKS